MRTNKDFILRQIVGENVLVPTGEAAANINGMIHLSDTGVFIWPLYDQKETLEEIAEAVCEEFEIDGETAMKDVKAFTRVLVGAGMVVDVPGME